MHFIATVSVIALTALLLLPSNASAQTADFADTVVADSCLPRGRMVLLMTGHVNVAGLDELNAVLVDNGYSALEERGTNPMRSAGMDVLVCSGFKRVVFSVSYRFLFGANSDGPGYARHRGMYFSFGSAWYVSLTRSLRLALGYTTEFGILAAELQRGNPESFSFNPDFESAIALGRGDSTARVLNVNQISLGPIVNLHWSALTWKKEGKATGTLELGLKAQYNFPVLSAMDVDGARVETPSFNFSRMLFGISLGAGVEL